MMNGKEVQRAFRGHLMVDQCITQQIVSKIVERYSGFQEVVNELETLYLKLKSNEESLDIALQSECIHKIDKILNCTKSELSKTSALWINYQRMLSIARAFIASDRMGSWNLHVDALRSCLPIFAAAGHSNYLKSVFCIVKNVCFRK